MVRFSQISTLYVSSLGVKTMKLQRGQTYKNWKIQQADGTWRAMSYGVSIQANSADQLKLMIDKKMVDAHQIWLTSNTIN